MRAFTSVRYTVDIGHHSYPMDKYRLVPERLLTEKILAPEDLLEPEAATLKWAGLPGSTATGYGC